MTNLTTETTKKDFYLWVNPSDFLVQHHVGLIGGFASIPDQSEHLMLIPNPNFNGFISPFQNNLSRYYLAEYNLELARRQLYSKYLSRLEAIFLLETKEEAKKYYETHPEHVGNRVLKKAYTEGEYTYSLHDASWIDFMRLAHSMDEATINNVCEAYWTGKPITGRKLVSMGKEWTSISILEVLFKGHIIFYSKSLENDDF